MARLRRAMLGLAMVGAAVAAKLANQTSTSPPAMNTSLKKRLLSSRERALGQDEVAADMGHGKKRHKREQGSEANAEALAEFCGGGAACGEEEVAGLGAALESVVALARHDPYRTKTAFHLRQPPPISIRDYVSRIRKYLDCSCECFVLCLVYIDSVIARHRDIVVDSLSVHKLIVGSMALAVKFQDDTRRGNKFLAEVAGIKLQDLNSLELRMLQLLDYELFVSPGVFEKYRKIVRSAACNKTLLRGLARIP